MDYMKAVVVVQRWYRRVRLSRKLLLRSQLDDFFSNDGSKSALDIFRFGLLLQSVYDKDEDQVRLHRFCSEILSSMESNNLESWYVSVSLNKEHSVKWMKQVKWLLLSTTTRLPHLKPGMPRDDQLIQTFLATFVLLSDYSLWKLSQKGGSALKPVLHKMCTTFVDHLIENDVFYFLHEILLNGLSHPRIKLSKYALPAAMGLRVIALMGFSDHCLSLFVCNILTVPAVVWHLKLLSVDSFNSMQKLDVFARCIKLLKQSNIVSCKNKTEILAIFGNLIQLKCLQNEEKKFSDDLNVLMLLLSSLIEKTETKPVIATCWHLIFGWSDQTTSNRLLDCLPHLKFQLQLLWHPSYIEVLFGPVLALKWSLLSEKKKAHALPFKKMFSSTSCTVSQEDIKKTCISAQFYDKCLQVLPQISSDLLIGLSSNGHLPAKLWCFLSEIIHIDIKTVLCELKTNSPIVIVVKIMCQTTQYLLSILDDHELYEEQQYFPIQKLEQLILFLNSLIYLCIWEQSTMFDDFSALQSCLTCLLQRNQRRTIVAENKLLIKEFRCSKFMSEWKSHTPRALAILQYIPYIVPHSKRVEIFYEYIKADKAELGIKSGHSHVPASYITVHRNRILDNGYEQLHSLSTVNIKGIIRVKFVNEQGLEEAGIDELGVFKEFLEEAIKQAFNPSLGLFKANADGLLYPSHTSECHENHLGIFEFLGRILGKAVYEGIVVDLPFATFFLQHIVKQSRNMFYSSLDELHSLDPELSKSLHFIKHYDGDLSDMCLTFSYEENFLGKMVTHELIPGGSGISVTSENKINYIHRFAHYKLTTQIKEQTAAFMKGFHSIINPQWMSIFSAEEFQKVISGIDSDIDIDELRRHTHYYGGYHDKHRVICWLWDILKNDFTGAERSAFLKFVTSCSRQPLLGFCTLDPPFSIRRVDSPNEEETVNVAGAFRTLLGIKSSYKDRLPTSSTCFNLLKLPDYNKKSILKEKLLFSISANAGFELS